MKLYKIAIVNYRQYKGENIINFSVDPNKNFTVIQGESGTGKSNIMNTIIWCLYGDEMFRSKNEGRKIMNEHALQELRDGESADASVTVVIGEYGPKYEFKRKITYTRQGNHYAEGGNVFSGREITDDKGWVTITNPEWFIEKRFIPKDLRGFFFFDGEKMDDYFEDTSKVKTNVEKIAQISILNDTIATLKDVHRAYSKEISNLKPEQRNNLDDYEIWAQERDTAIEEKKEVDERLPEVVERRREIDGYLRNNSDDIVKQIQRTRDVLEAQRSEAIRKQSRNDGDIRSLISDRVAILLSIQSIVSSKKLIDEETEKGVLPPDIKDVFIKDLIQKGVCICGRDLKEDTECRKNVEKLLERIMPSEIADDAVSAKYVLTAMIEKKDFKDEYTKYLRIRKQCKDEISDLTDKIDAESSRLEKYDLEEIRSLEHERSKLEEEERQLNKRSGALGNKRREYDRKMDDLRKVIESAVSSERKALNLQKQMEYAKRLEGLMLEIKENIIEEVRERLESKTKRYFFNMIWKKEAFSDVRILDDGKQYKISVKSEYGRECLGDISAGERQVLALSFTAALYSISGYSVPVMIDTPLGRISGLPRENIAKALPNYMSETQVVMLATDTEYTSSVRERLKEKVGAEYRISHDEKTKTSKVINYE